MASLAQVTTAMEQFLTVTADEAASAVDFVRRRRDTTSVQTRMTIHLRYGG